MELLGRLAALSLLLIPLAAQSQPGSASLPTVPTTRILAIGRLSARPTPDQMKLLGSREVPETVRLYLAGKIDQWYSIQNGFGVVFILNVSSVQEAQTLLDALPLGQAHLMAFELIPLGPLTPLGLLLPPKSTPSAQ